VTSYAGSRLNRLFGLTGVTRQPFPHRDKRLVGIVSLGDVAMVEGRGAAGAAITAVSRPGGPHSQTARS
jgi:hypothetical protein